MSAPGLWFLQTPRPGSHRPTDPVSTTQFTRSPSLASVAPTRLSSGAWKRFLRPECEEIWKKQEGFRDDTSPVGVVTRSGVGIQPVLLWNTSTLCIMITLATRGMLICRQWVEEQPPRRRVCALSPHTYGCDLIRETSLRRWS